MLSSTVASLNNKGVSEMSLHSNNGFTFHLSVTYIFEKPGCSRRKGGLCTNPPRSPYKVLQKTLKILNLGQRFSQSTNSRLNWLS